MRIGNAQAPNFTLIFQRWCASLSTASLETHSKKVVHSKNFFLQCEPMLK